LLVASVLLLYMPTRAAGLPTKVFALDESRISASNLHVINFDMTALADYYTDKLIDASKLNAVNEELRLDGFKREYPDAVHAFAHIRPCLVNCGNAYGGVAWLVNSFYPENGLLVRILQEHVPGFCVDDGRESCFYTVTPEMVFHVANRTPGTYGYASKIVPLKDTPTIELDLSVSSALWSETHYGGYVLTDKYLALIGRSPGSANSNSSVQVITSTMLLPRRIIYTADDWFRDSLHTVQVDPNTLCTVDSADVPQPEGTRNACFRLHRGTNSLPMAMAIDGTTRRPLTTVDVTGVMSTSGGPGRLPVSWGHREYTIHRHKPLFGGANHGDEGVAGVRTAELDTEPEPAVKHVPYSANAVVWGKRAVSQYVESITGDFTRLSAPRVTFTLSASSSLVPTVGWARAILIVVIMLVFFRRNLAPGTELRYAIRQVHYLEGYATISPPVLPTGVLYAPSNPPENRIPLGGFIADLLLLLIFTGSAIAYWISSAVYDFQRPAYTAFTVFTVMSCVNFVVYVVNLCVLAWLASRQLNESEVRSSSARRNNNNKPHGAPGKGFFRAVLQQSTFAAAKRDKPLETSAILNAYAPSTLTTMQRAVGNQISFSAIVYLMWWDTDNLFDWGFITVALGVAAVLMLYHALETLLLCVADSAGTYFRNRLPLPRALQDWLNIDGDAPWRVAYVAYVLLCTGVFYGMVVPQIILPYARWVASTDVIDSVADYIAWLIVLPAPLIVVLLQVNRIIKSEHDKAVARLDQYGKNRRATTV